MTLVRTLDRHVFGGWLKLFVLASLGLPLVFILINLTDTLNKLLDRGLTTREIVVSYVYSIPENAFMVIPAAVLLATVFTVGGMSRYSEITAAKAGGWSFHRVMLPIFVGSIIAMVLTFIVGEVAPGASARERELQKATPPRSTSARYNFVYRADAGWVYTIRSLDIANRQLKGLMLERPGDGLRYPGLIITADSASYDRRRHGWRLRDGTSRVVSGPNRQVSFAFKTMQLRALTQAPADLLAESKAPEEMRYAELGRYIDALKRSGNDANKLIVQQGLRLALPATCVIIALFGAPLAVQAPRAGAAVGIAVSLGTFLTFLLLTQLMQAVGAGGVVDPIVAAWLPNAMFLLAGLVLLARVRT